MLKETGQTFSLHSGFREIKVTACVSKSTHRGWRQFVMNHVMSTRQILHVLTFRCNRSPQSARVAGQISHNFPCRNVITD